MTSHSTKIVDLSTFDKPYSKTLMTPRVISTNPKQTKSNKSGILISRDEQNTTESIRIPLTYPQEPRTCSKKYVEYTVFFDKLSFSYKALDDVDQIVNKYLNIASECFTEINGNKKIFLSAITSQNIEPFRSTDALGYVLQFSKIENRNGLEMCFTYVLDALYPEIIVFNECSNVDLKTALGVSIQQHYENTTRTGISSCTTIKFDGCSGTNYFTALEYMRVVLPSLKCLVVENDDDFSDDHFAAFVHLFGISGCDIYLNNCGNITSDAFKGKYSNLIAHRVESNRMRLHINNCNSLRHSITTTCDESLNKLALLDSCNLRSVTIQECVLSEATLTWLKNTTLRRIVLDRCVVKLGSEQSLDAFMADICLNSTASVIELHTTSTRSKFPDRPIWLVELLMGVKSIDDPKTKDEWVKRRIIWKGASSYVIDMLSYIGEGGDDTTYDELMLATDGRLLLKIEDAVV